MEASEDEMLADQCKTFGVCIACGTPFLWPGINSKLERKLKELEFTYTQAYKNSNRFLFQSPEKSHVVHKWGRGIYNMIISLENDKEGLTEETLRIELLKGQKVNYLGSEWSIVGFVTDVKHYRIDNGVYQTEVRPQYVAGNLTNSFSAVDLSEFTQIIDAYGPDFSRKETRDFLDNLAQDKTTLMCKSCNSCATVDAERKDFSIRMSTQHDKKQPDITESLVRDILRRNSDFVLGTSIRFATVFVLLVIQILAIAKKIQKTDKEGGSTKKAYLFRYITQQNYYLAMLTWVFYRCVIPCWKVEFEDFYTFYMETAVGFPMTLDAFRKHIGENRDISELILNHNKIYNRYNEIDTEMLQKSMQMIVTFLRTPGQGGYYLHQYPCGLQLVKLSARELDKRVYMTPHFFHNIYLQPQWSTRYPLMDRIVEMRAQVQHNVNTLNPQCWSHFFGYYKYLYRFIRSMLLYMPNEDVRKHAVDLWENAVLYSS